MTALTDARNLFARFIAFPFQDMQIVDDLQACAEQCEPIRDILNAEPEAQKIIFHKLYALESHEPKLSKWPDKYADFFLELEG